ncbi:AbrB/MazE/SpoVT family DNA-binding domain-containing protein (plasmid) [Roseibium aggregatum]|uniref:AbrB/MazE/SpoVT family DNA-binding domain-containing protein n=1 Tax=Roseibium aggregatum TaxID=187304 RepID=UPI001E42DC7F|nr:AbrB/MazE/SpoVT family DNA-binding domain-containing protein [Roseibium aggregatum]UES60099.1 AbrB/MazE/SpoVT family DNA-binding domain-containing protein [Roseibium aggregatum]
MSVANIRRNGGSHIVTIPPALLDQIKLSTGDAVEILAKEGHIEIRPVKKFTLDDMLAKCDLEAPIEHDDEDEIFLGSGPVGSEEI